jgi:hypothetical protein
VTQKLLARAKTSAAENSEGQNKYVSRYSHSQSTFKKKEGKIFVSSDIR